MKGNIRDTEGNTKGKEEQNCQPMGGQIGSGQLMDRSGRVDGQSSTG